MKKIFFINRWLLLLAVFAVLAFLQTAQLQGQPDDQPAEIQNVFIGPMRLPPGATTPQIPRRGSPSYPAVPAGAGVPSVPASPGTSPGPPPPLPQRPAADGDESSLDNSSSQTEKPEGLPFGPMEYLQRLKDEARREADEIRKKAKQAQEDDVPIEGIQKGSAGL